MNAMNLHTRAVWLAIKSKSLGLIKNKRSLLFIILVSSLLSACQVTPQPTEVVVKNTLSYSQYYLELKTLNKKQLLAEEQKQKSLMVDQTNENTGFTQSKLILIYSLPNTPIHRPYKAKRLLNELLIVKNNMSKENTAFTMLLRDQLNTQLHLLEKQNATDKDCNEQLDQHHMLIKQLQMQLDQVNQQLILLKKIDLNINERG